MMGFGLIVILLLVGAVAYAGGWRPNFSGINSATSVPPSRTAVDIVRERYARGEITREEYLRAREDMMAMTH